MKNNTEWDVFTQTGKVMDYLKYTGAVKNNCAENAKKEERAQDEGTHEGHGAICGYHR